MKQKCSLPVKGRQNARPMTKRNKRPSRPLVAPVLESGLFGVQAPTWPAIKAALETLPEGWRSELASVLNVRPSAITMMMQRPGQPSYQRVIDVLSWLQGKGVEVS